MPKCENCLWHRQCHTDGDCDDFSPAELDIEQVIEERYCEFKQEWEEYITIMGN